MNYYNQTMKTKLFFFFSFFGCVLLCHGQKQNDFQSYFGHETTEWYVVFSDWDSDGTLNFITDGDTIIEGRQYKKMISSGRSNERFMREDASTGRLWCRIDQMNNNCWEDVLVADMSLSLNDTIVLRNSLSRYQDTLQYIVVDSAMIDNRRTLTLECITPGYVRTIKFIEGVGGTNTFDTYSQYIESCVICCYKDGELIYRDSRTDTCVLGWEEIDESEKERIVNIWPNPFDEWFFVDGDCIQKATLYDSRGHVVMDDLDVRKRMEVKNMPKGVYFLQIITDNSSLIKTIIKE